MHRARIDHIDGLFIVSASGDATTVAEAGFQKVF